MDIAKQIVDQRVTGLIKERPDLLSDTDEKNISKAFLLLGVSSYLDVEIQEAEQYITDGGNDGGFDAAYIVDGSDMQLNVVLFQSKYTRNLEKDTNFPANAVEKGEGFLKMILQDYLGSNTLHDLDGRTVAAPFRRYDLMMQYIQNDVWWNKNI